MNIYDIAAKCGVSIATVSRVLNNSDRVRPATRDKVLAVMAEENYAPNAFARGLGMGSMRMVGVLCTSLRDTFYAEAVAHVEEHLRAQGLNAIVRCTGDTPEERRQSLEYIVSRHVDGVVLIGSTFCEEGNTIPIATAAAQVPVVIINGYVDVPGVYGITADEKGAVRDVVSQIMSRQRRRILFLHDKLTYSCQQKLAGYQEGYEAAGLPVDPQLIVPVERSLDAVNTCIKQLLVKGVSFDAVIGAEDILALGTQKALQRIGLTLPVVGFNNSLLARCATPELSSIDNDLPALCHTAMATLDTLLEGGSATPHTVLPARLIERDTFRNN